MMENESFWLMLNVVRPPSSRDLVLPEVTPEKRLVRAKRCQVLLFEFQERA